MKDYVCLRDQKNGGSLYLSLYFQKCAVKVILTYMPDGLLYGQDIQFTALIHGQIIELMIMLEIQLI